MDSASLLGILSSGGGKDMPALGPLNPATLGEGILLVRRFWRIEPDRL